VTSVPNACVAGVRVLWVEFFCLPQVVECLLDCGALAGNVELGTVSDLEAFLLGDYGGELQRGF
jgi:hypothetical protein